MIGIIGGVEDHGSIVVVWLNLDDATRKPVYMDHRAFGWMVEGEGIETIGELEGRSVRFDGQTIEFVETQEIA